MRIVRRVRTAAGLPPFFSGEFFPVSEPRDTRRATPLRVGAFGPLPALLERQGLAVDDDGLLAIAAEARVILGRLAALGVALARWGEDGKRRARCERRAPRTSRARVVARASSKGRKRLESSSGMVQNSAPSTTRPAMRAAFSLRCPRASAAAALQSVVRLGGRAQRCSVVERGLDLGARLHHRELAVRGEPAATHVAPSLRWSGW